MTTKHITDAIGEVLTEVLRFVFCDMALCTWEHSCHDFGGACCFHLQRCPRKVYSVDGSNKLFRNVGIYIRDIIDHKNRNVSIINDVMKFNTNHMINDYTFSVTGVSFIVSLSTAGVNGMSPGMQDSCATKLPRSGTR